MRVTPSEYAQGVTTMIGAARRSGGGRSSCCARGQCALHLAEEHPAGGTYSTLHTGRGIALVWNHGDQEVAAAFARAAYAHARTRMVAA